MVLFITDKIFIENLENIFCIFDRFFAIWKQCTLQGVIELNSNFYFLSIKSGCRRDQN